ncbi:Retrovirus-related Pol polyprotein from transposon RE1 [Linum grandiflorum]
MAFASLSDDEPVVPPGFTAPPPPIIAQPPPVGSSGSASALGILDASHPYYIHPSESWGQSLVSTTLTEFSYSEWSMAISMVLDGKNKIGFVDGTISAPDPGQPLYPLWVRNNKLVLSWILHSVSPNIAKSILYSKTAKAAWTALRSRFSQGDVFKIADLQEQIFSLKQGTHTVTEYFTHLITLYDKLSNFRPIPDCSSYTDQASSDTTEDILQLFNANTITLEKNATTFNRKAETLKKNATTLKELRESMSIIISQLKQEGYDLPGFQEETLATPQQPSLLVKETTSVEKLLSGLSKMIESRFDDIEAGRSPPSCVWILDSGASDHIDFPRLRTIGTTRLSQGLYLMSTSAHQHEMVKTLFSYSAAPASSGVISHLFLLPLRQLVPVL